MHVGDKITGDIRSNSIDRLTMQNNCLENNPHILCPIDLSEASERVVAYALSFAAYFDAKLTFLHVCTRPPDVYFRFFPDVTGYLKSLEEDIQLEVSAYRQHLKLKDEIIIRYGTVNQEVLQFVQDEDVDMIVLDAGSFTSNATVLLSTEAQKIIRKATCPVLTVHGKKTSAKIDRILCPVDLSERSYRALKTAAVLSLRFDATITLLHVVELHEFRKRRTNIFRSEEAFAHMCEVLKSEMAIPEDLANLPIKKEIRRNVDAAAEIAYFAEQEGSDLITLTTHGHGYWPRMLLGSVTEKIVQIAPCPVLTVHIQK